MAAIPISNGGLQAGPDNADNYITFSGQWNRNAQGFITVILKVTAITGTAITFGLSRLGGAIPGDAAPVPVNGSISLTLNPDVQELHYQCSNALDAFTASS